MSEHDIDLMYREDAYWREHDYWNPIQQEWDERARAEFEAQFDEPEEDEEW